MDPCSVNSFYVWDQVCPAFGFSNPELSFFYEIKGGALVLAQVNMWKNSGCVHMLLVSTRSINQQIRGKLTVNSERLVAQISTIHNYKLQKDPVKIK